MMKLTDKEVIDLIKASALNDTDNYFALGTMPGRDEIEKHAKMFNGRTLVLTPGRPFNRMSETVIYADIGVSSHENFSDFLVSERITEILLPFYECADVNEYGYKASYLNIAEIRASIEKRVHITGISPNTAENEKIFSLLGSDKFIQVGTKNDTLFTGIKTVSDKSKYHYTASECEKSPFRKTVVMFSTRRQAEEFSLFLYKRRTPFTMLHGGVDKIRSKDALRSFLTGEVNILLTTKFIIPSYTLIYADKLIYCGLPYSLSHARRCLSLAKNRKMDCIFSEEDILLTEKLISSFAKELDINTPDYIETRNKMFFDFLNEMQY